MSTPRNRHYYVFQQQLYSLGHKFCFKRNENGSLAWTSFKFSVSSFQFPRLAGSSTSFEFLFSNPKPQNLSYFLRYVCYAKRLLDKSITTPVQYFLCLAVYAVTA